MLDKVCCAVRRKPLQHENQRSTMIKTNVYNPVTRRLKPLARASATTTLKLVYEQINSACRAKLAVRRQSLAAGVHLGPATVLTANTTNTQLVSRAICEMAALSSRGCDVLISTSVDGKSLRIEIAGSNKLDLPEDFLTGFVSMDRSFQKMVDGAGATMSLFWRRNGGPTLELSLPMAATPLRAARTSRDPRKTIKVRRDAPAT